MQTQHLLSTSHSLLDTFIAEMRHIQIQKDSMRFRRNMERVGEIFAYEISKTLEYTPSEVQTPLGIASTHLSNEHIVLATILRAGLPLHQGFLNYFDKAENAFISAYRKYSKDHKFNIQLEYTSSPSLEDKILILLDPMLATGASMSLAYRALVERGSPKYTHFVAPIASTDGVNYLTQQYQSAKNVTLWLGAVDEELTLKSYIVPGLGDAGDLAYGCKI